MSAWTLSGAPVALASLVLPRVGVWTATVRVLTETAITGAVELVAEGGLTYRGTVVRGAVEGRVWSGLVAGGAGGLRRALPARAYRGATLADVVADALREAGETAAPGLGDLSSVASLWLRHQEPAGRTLARVASTLGYAWRVLPDGSVWLGPEGWTDASGEPDVLSRDPRAGRWVLSGDTLGLLPGTLLPLPDDTGALEAVRVAEVRHEVTPETVRAIVTAEADDA